VRQLNVSIPLQAPASFTLAFLRTYFQAQARGVAAAKIRLRLPTHAVTGGIAVEKTVEAEVSYVLGHGAPDALQISWVPEASGAFPRFQGTFTASPETEETCRLSLSGRYAVPGGVPGDMFDVVVGRRIARSSIGDFVERLGTAAEADYRTRCSL